jgi:EamA-like transporter family
MRAPGSAGGGPDPGCWDRRVTTTRRSDLRAALPTAQQPVTPASSSPSVGTVLGARRPLPADPFVTTVLEMAVGGTAMVLLGTFGGEWQRLDVATVGVSAWLAYADLILVGSAVAYSAYVWLLARAPVSLATTYAEANPAVALGALFLAEPLTGSVLVGRAVIAVAVAGRTGVTGRPAGKRRSLQARSTR